MTQPRMSGRERVLAALSCQPTDVVPFDLGGIKTTSLNVHAYEKLRASSGIKAPVEWGHFRSQRTHMAEEMSRYLDADVRRVHVAYPSPMPEELTRSVQLDEWGVEWTQATTGLYFVSHPPLADADRLSDLRQYRWPDPSTLQPIQALAAAARRLRRETDCAVCLDLPDAVVHTSQHLRGYENWLMDTAVNVPFLEVLLDYVTDIYVAMVGPLLEAVGDDVDLVLICDDIAVQRGPLINPDMYRKLIKPRQAKILEAIRSNSPAKILFHSCGSVYWALGDLIGIGIDGINPVQLSAAEMEPRRLKREFGDRLCFWGGVDTQYVLPFGRPDDVREEVRRRIEDLAAGGGYVIGPVHIIQAEVPAENILAMAEAAHVYGARSDGRQFRSPVRQ